MWGLVCKYATYRLTSSTWPPKGQWLLPLLRFLPLVPVNEVSKPSLSIALRNTDIKRMRINYNNAYRVYRIHQKRIKCYHLLILSQLSEMRTRGCRGANLAAPAGESDQAYQPAGPCLTWHTRPVSAPSRWHMSLSEKLPWPESYRNHLRFRRDRSTETNKGD